MLTRFLALFGVIFGVTMISLTALHHEEYPSFANNRLLDHTKVTKMVVIEDLSSGFEAVHTLNMERMKPPPQRYADNPVCATLWFGKTPVQQDDATIRLSLSTATHRDDITFQNRQILDRQQRFCFDKIPVNALKSGPVQLKIESLDAPPGKGPLLILTPSLSADHPIQLNGRMTENTLPYSLEMQIAPGGRQIMLSLLIAALNAAIIALLLMGCMAERKTSAVSP